MEAMPKKYLLVVVVLVALISLGMAGCNARVQSRPRPAMASREARSTAKVAAKASEVTVLSRLRCQFVIPLEYGKKSREVSLAPGGPITLSVRVENPGAQPIRDLQVLFRPAKHLEFVPGPLSGDSSRQRDAEAFTKLVTTGLPVYDNEGRTEILPQGDPHYPESIGFFSTRESLFDPRPGKEVMLNNQLVISRNLQPGEDIQIEAVLLLGGQERVLDPVTVHVMYVERPQPEPEVKVETQHCRGDLISLRGGIGNFKIFFGQYPKSLREAMEKSIPKMQPRRTKCEDSGTPFKYDPKTGEVHCQTPGHESF